MGWIIFAIIVLAIIAFAIKRIAPKEIGNNSNYAKRDDFLSLAERSFFGVLQDAVQDKALVFCKVRVADILFVKSGLEKGERMKAFNRIAKKHVDFVICTKDDVSVLCAIELNDSSHNSSSRQKRDDFLVSAFDSANLPLIQMPAKKSYSINDIREQLKPIIGIDNSEVQANVVDTDIEEPEAPMNDINEDADGKVCPKCSAALVKRTASKGKNTGNSFWACSAFPKCRYTEDIYNIKT